MSAGHQPRHHRASLIAAFLAVAAGGLTVGFLLGLARPRFGPDGDRLTWDTP